jgi:hypothetical protein
MTDTFAVTAAYDAPSYAQGQPITVTISGNDVLTQQVPSTVGPLSLTLTAADGATTTLTVPSAPVTLTTTTPESVRISSVQDTAATPRAWTIAASGLSISAIA